MGGVMGGVVGGVMLGCPTDADGLAFTAVTWACAGDKATSKPAVAVTTTMSTPTMAAFAFFRYLDIFASRGGVTGQEASQVKRRMKANTVSATSAQPHPPAVLFSPPATLPVIPSELLRLPARSRSMLQASRSAW
jgi:hypothetical protein